MEAQLFEGKNAVQLFEGILWGQMNSSSSDFSAKC